MNATAIKAIMIRIVCISLSLIPLASNTQDIFDSTYSSLLDESAFGLNEDTYSMLDEEIITTSINRASPEDILQLLIELGALNILQQNFYLRTNPIAKRNVLDLPLFEPITCHDMKNWNVGGHFFWNYTNESNFTKDSTHISSYLALQEPTLLAALESAASSLKPLFGDDVLNIDITKILGLFKNTKLEQRRVGTLFYADRLWNHVHGRFMVPIYYFERNFFLTNDERDAIESEFGVLGENDQARFQRAHLVSDRLGVGDFRIELDTPVFEGEKWYINGGLMATVPTAWNFKRGLYGSHFPPSSTVPCFDFDELFALADSAPNIPVAQQAYAFSLIEKLLLCAVDRLSANLLDTPLGNNGHFGLGLLMRTFTTLDQTPVSFFYRAEWLKDITVCGRASLEYLFPAKEDRFFINCINPEDFDERNFEDPNQAVANLTFLEEEFINRIFPRAFQTMVYPGLIFRWTSNMGYRKKHAGIRITSDFWLQTAEKFGPIEAPFTEFNQIRIQIAKLPLAYQSKIGATVFYTYDRDERTWFMSLGAECTTFKQAMGRDWTVDINIEARF